MSRKLHALLIGIDFYSPSISGAGASYPSLRGCVQDVVLVENFLRTKLQVPEEQITKLTATNREPEFPPEPPEALPTYANMVVAFQRVCEAAEPGDQVYIHYSGHGGRVVTKFEDLKGRNAKDETLVPTDIGDTEARHLRDIELAHLLQTMVRKELVVTLTLDSCHSGGATRAPGISAPRGVARVDRTRRPKDSLVASDRELRATWKAISGGATRNASLAGGWLPDPRGYVLLAACRESELANETPVDGQWRGAFTWWLLDSLRHVRPGLSYRALHDRIVGKVHSAFPSQTPQLHGEGNRTVFGIEDVAPRFAVNVLGVDDAGAVRLNTGAAQGVGRGATFFVYPPGVDFNRVDRRLAVVEVTAPGASESTATIVERLSDEGLEAGAQAVLHEAGPTTLKRHVQLAPPDGRAVALSQVRKVIGRQGAGYVAVAGEGDTVDFSLGVTPTGDYEIRDPSGAPLPNLRPPIAADERGATQHLVKRLVHLAKYRNVLELNNGDAMSPLAGALHVELLDMQENFTPGDRPDPRPFSDPGNTPELAPGDWAFLRIRNTSAGALNIVVLDLSPDWAVTQVFPNRSDTAYAHLDSGRSIEITLRADLPVGYTTGTDVLKVFATLDAVNFAWLELPALDQPGTRGGITGRPASRLEELLSAVAVGAPETRNVVVAASTGAEWTSGEVEMRVRRSGRGSSGSAVTAPGKKKVTRKKKAAPKK